MTKGSRPILTYIVFEEGAQWTRATFICTPAQTASSTTTGDDNFYNRNYVDALEKAGIRLGVITNHNKFDFEEFKALRKTAQKKILALLPGVELSSTTGLMASTLCRFFRRWLADGHDHINPFLGVAFEGKVPASTSRKTALLSVAAGNHQEAGKLSPRLFPCLCPCRSTSGCGPS